ncbi:MAG: hypothetical protein WAV00_11960 [Nocardioides sp.]
MRRVMIGPALLLTWAFFLSPAWAGAVGTADLATTITWTGPGTPHAQDGGMATWTVRVTNLGPAAAEGWG